MVEDQPGAPMEERARRIVDSAIELAEQGGFEAVRLRDVAAHAGVALGTVYKRFRSKEDILVAAIEREFGPLEHAARTMTFDGKSPPERVTAFFTLATRALCMRPHLARAVLRAVASGVPDVAERVTRFHGRVTHLVNRAIGGQDEPAPDSDTRLAFLLQQIWFAALVGWMSGIHGEDEVIEQVRYATERLFTQR